jgi:hypothetical protein
MVARTTLEQLITVRARGQDRRRDRLGHPACATGSWIRIDEQSLPTTPDRWSAAVVETPNDRHVRSHRKTAPGLTRRAAAGDDGRGRGTGSSGEPIARWHVVLGPAADLAIRHVSMLTDHDPDRASR